jgi:hypothetical protein
MSRGETIDRYFLEHRAKLVDIAAFLDRLDRARPDGADGEDYRVAALRRATAELQSDVPGRARRVLELLSDPTTDAIDSAKGMKGAFGAYEA